MRTQFQMWPDSEQVFTGFRQSWTRIQIHSGGIVSKLFEICWKNRRFQYRSDILQKLVENAFLILLYVKSGVIFAPLLIFDEPVTAYILSKEPFGSFFCNLETQKIRHTKYCKDFLNAGERRCEDTEVRVRGLHLDAPHAAENALEGEAKWLYSWLRSNQNITSLANNQPYK